jgi:hypothetical protein
MAHAGLGEWIGWDMVDDNKQKPLGAIAATGIFILGIPTAIILSYLVPNHLLSFPEALLDICIIAVTAVVLCYGIYHWEKNSSKGWKRFLPSIILLVVFIATISYQLNSSYINSIFSNQSEPDTVNNTSTDIPDVGSDYQFGDLTWQVLDVKDGRALLITEDIVEFRAYNDTDTDVTWETCSLRAYLNGEFLDKHFSAAEQERIMLSAINNDDNPDYGTDGGNDTQDKLFLMSISGVKNYFPSDADRVAKYQVSADWWWLRSPGGSADRAAYVSSNGRVYADGYYVDYDNNGVRPALWLNL